MRVEELRETLRQAEGKHLEFKRSLNPSRLAREVVAFANTEGGKIIIGVEDNGNIVGVENINTVKSQIQNLADQCDPPVSILFDEVVEEDVLIVDIPRSDQFHMCSDGFFARRGPNSVSLSREEIEQRIQRSRASPFDKAVVESFQFPEDFDEDCFQKFIDRSGASPDALDHIPETLVGLGAAIAEREDIAFTNAGTLFFGEKPQRFIVNAEIICVSYLSSDRVDFKDREVQEGNIFEQIEGARAFLEKNLDSRYIIDEVTRKKIFEIPINVLREAIINAIMHRDYLNTSQSILIEIFPSRVLIRNPGGLMEGMRKSDLGSRTMRRNPLLAILLDKANFAERMGTGINRMRRGMRERGLPEPSFEINGEFIVTFVRAAEITSSGAEVKSITDRQGEVLHYVAKEGSITTKQYSEMFDISKSKARREIKDLVEKGLLVKKGRTRGTFYVAKR